ncbi:hypothetical protein QTP88_013142 [Uroleucon formosanum]
MLLWAKCFMQLLWCTKLGWDDQMSDELQAMWQQFCTELPLVFDLCLPRHIDATGYQDIQLLGFADASVKGYAAVIYLRIVDTADNTSAKFITCKTKVSPLKSSAADESLSIPRLELCGALLLARTLHHVHSVLSSEIPVSRCKRGRTHRQFVPCAVFDMSEINEQRVSIKFCLKLGKNETETYTMIKTAFGEYSLSRSVTFEWYKRFKDGRQSTDDDPRSGRPSTSRNDDVVKKIKEKVRNDRRLTVRELANEAGISIGSCDEILTENLQMKRTWVYGYDPETKFQSSQWITKFSPRPKKARQVRSNVKTMLIVFFDIEGIIHYEFVPHGQTVNQVFYKDVLIRLRERIRKKRPEKWRNGTWFLHHDNAPAHSALSIREFLADKKIPVVPHPSYSSDLAPCDFFLFPRLKSALKGQRFQDVEEIKANTAAELKAITLEQFQRTFQK